MLMFSPMSMLGFLKRQKWLAGFVGVIAVCVIIFVFGPHISFGTYRPLRPIEMRLLAVGIVLLVWGLGLLLKHLKARRENAKMAEGLAGGDGGADHAADVEALQENLYEALDILKRTRVQGSFGRQYLYELPWYIIIGPPGSGKTTALAKSGLDFPLAERMGRAPIRGVGGTRNCDWWFTNEAVLLDTAGRYTTQDSAKAADAAAWNGFLDLLRKHRPRRPINGVIVAISVTDLMVDSEAERAQHAATIRQRIQELYDHLGVQCPIYLMFTKADLVAGFTEFFDDLGKEQRGQVWGMTFPEDDIRRGINPVDRFEEHYQELIERLNERMLWRLHQERDTTRRALITRFPQQMTNMAGNLAEFLDRTFTPTRFSTPFLVRGVYLTSGTREGTPIDRVVAALARDFGLDQRNVPAHPGSGKSYFIHRLLKNVIFEEEDLAGTNRRFERQRRWVQVAAYSATAIAVAAVVFAWSVSFTRNQTHIQKLANRIDVYEQEAARIQPVASEADVLPALRYAEDITEVYGTTPEESPWLMGMGLYQGLRLGGAAQQAYIGALHQLWLPRLTTRLETYIARGQEHPSELRRALNVYLMLGNPDSLDDDLFTRWMTDDWQRRLEREADTQRALSEHLVALLNSDMPPQELDASLVVQAQRIICRIPLIDQVYSRLGEEADALGLPAFSLRVLPRDARAVFSSRSDDPARQEVRNLYTAAAHEQIVEARGLALTRSAIEENRTLCEDNPEVARADAEQLWRRVRERYYRDYIDDWDGFIRDVALVQPNTLNQAVDVLDELAGRNSPLIELSERITTETTLTELSPDADATDERADPVTREFEPLHELVRPSAGDDPLIAAALELFGDLNDYIYAIADASRVPQAAYDAAASQMAGNGGEAVTAMRREAKDFPAPVEQMLRDSAAHNWGLVLGAARAHVNSLWREQVYLECQKTIAGRYPVASDTTRSITFTDFGRFFGENGVLDEFVAAYLEPFVDTRSWRPRTRNEGSLGLSSSGLGQLQLANTIREMYFQDGGQRPIVRFSVRPISLDDDASRFRLEVDGQVTTYRHGPTRSTQMQWPGLSGAGQARLVFERLDGGRFGISKDGPWAWFRLLDDAQISPGGSRDRVLVTFATGGLDTTYELRASSVENPFSSGNTLSRFRCLESL